MSAHCNLDYVAELEDEISLEGLDGCTLEALWLRLSHRPNFTSKMPLDVNSKEFLWSFIVDNEEISMFKLPVPRDTLVIFNRYENMDSELGIVLEPHEEPKDIYPFHGIDDEKNEVRGSCHTYYSRIDVTDEVIHMTLAEATTNFKDSLVLVASQKLRNKALCIDTCIDKFWDLTLIQYVLLERIARSRYMGEITQGKGSLATMGENPKSMFYHRKRLLKLSLLTKQPHQQKGNKGQSYNGSLLHLTRFYVERRLKFVMMIQRAVEILRTKPNLSAQYSEVKEEMGMPEASCRKLFKSSEFQRYIKTAYVPYRSIYPDAQLHEWKWKAKDSEKTLRVMELANPDLQPSDVCKQDNDGDHDDDDEDESYPGILDQSKMLWGVGLLRQAYNIVEAAGPDGVSQSDMARLLGQTKLDSRTICRNLQRRNTVHSLMKDVGRQRVSRYVSHKYATTGHLTQEFKKERQKMMSMVDDHETPDSVPPDEGNISTLVDSGNMEGVEVGLEQWKGGNKKPTTGLLKSRIPASTEKKSENSKPENLSSNKPSEPKTPKTKGFVNLLEEMHLTYSNQKKNSPHVTTRMMKRANKIIETVRANKVINDAFKLQKMIVQAESEEGYPMKMDKKSLNRLLDKLAKGGFVKNIIVKLKCGMKEKKCLFVVHPSVTLDSSYMKSAIDQLKLKFLAVGPDTSKEGEGDEDGNEGGTCKSKSSKTNIEVGKSNSKAESVHCPTVGASVQELRNMHPAPAPTSRPTTKKMSATKGSLGPKFVRMRELHQLLFYLVWGYQGKENLDQEESWAAIGRANPDVQLSQDQREAMPTVYCPELSFKMFIPPLPNHVNVGNGWAFVCDIFLRLPLCIFVRFVSVSYQTDEVDLFLNHPVKRNLLVKHLPSLMRQTLLQGRRYVTYVTDLINRLCYIGLVQYGPQVMKEKDQQFIYINCSASLIDTTTSNPGYHQISADEEYVRKEYNFSTLQDVMQYWYDMWTICMHTPLGGHNCMQGKKITIQILERKPQIMATLVPATFEEATTKDMGNIPGDGRGAAGLDSAMFSHLKRNWSTTSVSMAATRTQALMAASNNDTGDKSTYEGSISYTQYLINTTHPTASYTLSPKQRLAGLKNVRLSVYKPRNGSEGQTMAIPVAMVDRRQQEDLKRKRDDSPSTEAEDSLTKTKSSRSNKQKKPASYQRELRRREKTPKRPYYDDEDRAALRRMNKLRVDWSPAEDSFLLLCKVSSNFLFPNKRSQMVTFSLVRDLLHGRFPEARNKTSRACQRRINYIMKNPTTEDNVAIFLEEVRQDSHIAKRFKTPRLPKNRKNLESIYADMFRNLVGALVIKFKSSSSRQCPDMPNSLEEFNHSYRVITTSSSIRNKLTIKEVATVDDIDFYVVNTLIYSSMCSKHDRESYAYQLYLTYQQYPQSLLNAVLTQMRVHQMISYKKCYNRSQVSQNCLPLSTSPFQLSVTYLHAFNFKYQYEIFGQAWLMLKQLLKKKHSALMSINDNASRVSEEQGLCESQEDGVQVMILHEGGFCAAIVALMATKRLIFDIVIPEQIIMMDQHHTQPNDHHSSLVRRYSSHSLLSGRDMSSPLVGLAGGIDVGNKTKGTHIVQERLKEVAAAASANQDLPSANRMDSRKKRHSMSEYLEVATAVPSKKAKLSSSEVMKLADKDAVNQSISLAACDDQDERMAGQGLLQEANSQMEGSHTEVDETDISLHQGRNVMPSASRLGLYMMRDQLSLAEVQEINIQHAQDNLVVNACEITCRLRPPPKQQDAFDSINSNNLDLADDILLPLTKLQVNQALEYRRKFILDSWSSLDEVVHLWQENGENKDYIDFAKKIYHYIEKHKEIGVSVSEIKSKFCDYDSVDVVSKVSHLEEAQALLRVGVLEVRWVTCAHARPWLIHTNKMRRSDYENMDQIKGHYHIDGRETVRVYEPPITIGKRRKEQNALAEIESEPISKKSSDIQDEPMNINSTVSNNSSDGKEIEESQVNEQCSSDIRVLKKGVKIEAKGYSETTEDKQEETLASKYTRTSDRISEKKADETFTCPSTEISAIGKLNVVTTSAIKRSGHSTKVRDTDEEAVRREKSTEKNQESSQYEQINIGVRPWVRLNGTLNRRVLDRLLGAVLSLVMERPGVSGYDIGCKFSPALLPAHCHELLDTLVTIKCVTRHRLLHSHKPSLFSDPVEFSLVDAEPYECDNQLLYEPSVDAILKLAMFIGDKKYSQDFLMGDSR
ncbi:unnamed protein product, partial [Meganyctiphanes norvegica]